MANGKKYWEVESPIEIRSEKNVVKVYVESGKVQVFPKVEGTKHGIGKGATIDLETMTEEELISFQALVNQSINVRMKLLKSSQSA